MVARFRQKEKLIEIQRSKNIEKIDVRLLVRDATGKVNLTDIMLQGGQVASIWTGHPAEIPWTTDE